MERNYIVEIYAIEQDEEIQTGIFGPLTEQEADGWCDMFNNIQKSEGVTKDWVLKIRQLSNPWTFGISKELRQKLWA